MGLNKSWDHKQGREAYPSRRSRDVFFETFASSLSFLYLPVARQGTAIPGIDRFAIKSWYKKSHHSDEKKKILFFFRRYGGGFMLEYPKLIYISLVFVILGAREKMV